jgi:hypothetical protein
MEDRPISHMKEGVTLSGTYSVEGDVVTVKTAFGVKSAQLGDTPAETLARILLRELYDDIGTGFPSKAPEKPI